jgi:hypothetical protein
MLPPELAAAAFVARLPLDSKLDQQAAVTALAALVRAERAAAAEAMRLRCVRAVTDYGDSCGWANTHLLIASVVRALPLE